MLRLLILGAVLAAASGCGTGTPTKPAPADTPTTTTPPVTEKTEVYDKVAPMPREVKR